MQRSFYSTSIWVGVVDIQMGMAGERHPHENFGSCLQLSIIGCNTNLTSLPDVIWEEGRVAPKVSPGTTPRPRNLPFPLHDVDAI